MLRHAGHSTDEDSTEGTSDNIVQYLWKNVRGALLATGEEVAIQLPAGEATTVHDVTLEAVDAYGGVGRATARITFEVEERKP